MNELLDKIKAWRENNTDKILHFLISGAITAGLTFIPKFPLWASILLTLWIGFCKEWRDYSLNKGVASMEDLAFDGLGIAVAAMIIDLVQWVISVG